MSVVTVVERCDCLRFFMLERGDKKQPCGLYIYFFFSFFIFPPQHLPPRLRRCSTTMEKMPINLVQITPRLLTNDYAG